MKIRYISLCVVLIDQLSKYFIAHYCHMGQSIVVLKNILSITYIDNPGAAFGFMASTQPWIRIPFFIFITFGAGLIVFAYQRLIPPEKFWQRFSLGLIWGGAMGNFIDRVFYRQVVDFIDVEKISFGNYHFPYIFNLADSAITVGLTVLIAISLFDKSVKSEGI
ncbi:MAG TPA: signal peptidase II [bacterium]|nr:signal peptidase II [bacterium]